MPHNANRIYSEILEIHSLIGNMSVIMGFKESTIEFVLVVFGYLNIIIDMNPSRKPGTISSYLLL